MSVLLTGLAKHYGRTQALHALDLRAADGRVTGFLGRNGAGKSTALRILMGLANADAGSAEVDGRRYRDLATPARTVGALLDPEAHHPGRTGRAHLLVLAAAAGLPSSRVTEVLDLVELAGAADRRVGGYSLGMRQRLHLAAALLGDPHTLVLDEPTNGLDPPGIRWLRDLLRAFAAEGRCVLLSSHVLTEVSQTVDDVVVVAGGRCVASGPLHEVFAGPPVPRLRVRTSTPHLLWDALDVPPADRATDPKGWFGVEGVPAPALARIARELDVLVTGLVEVEPDLEATFLALTTPTLEAS